MAIQAALAAFPPLKAAPQACRLRLVTRPTSNPSVSPFQRAFPAAESPLKRAKNGFFPAETSPQRAGLSPRLRRAKTAEAV